MIDKLVTYTLPAYWAGALINDDFSGMEESEITELNTFRTENHVGMAADWSEESFFTWSNDASHLGADCLEFTFFIS